MSETLLFEHPIEGFGSILVYQGDSLLATLKVGDKEYPLECKLKLDGEGRLDDPSRALLTRVLRGDLGLDLNKATAIELAFASKEFVEKIKSTKTSTILDPASAADAILEVFTLRTLADTEEILVYENGIYKPGGEVRVKAWLEAHVDEVTERLVNETLGHVRRRTYIERNRFDPDPFVLNLKNGLLDLRTYELKPHTPDYLSMVQLPVIYDPSANCPNISKFISEVLDPDDIPVVQEFVGYCLWRDYPAAKALLFVADGDNGKSTFINVIKALLGPGNFAARSLQELELNRFAKADLFGKLANLFADLPDAALKSTGTFKMLTGGDPITAEHKFRNSFTFTNYAKLIFSANKVPEVFEDTTGFFRRWLIITFPNQFSGDKADKNLLSKLITPQELSGFLNWALQGLKRLQSNGWNFTNSKSTAEIREEYIRKSSPIRTFLMDCTEVRSDGFVSKKELYAAFAAYCRKRKVPAVTDHTFFSNLPKFASVSEARPLQNGERVRGFIGLSLKPDSEWEEKSMEDGGHGGHGGHGGQEKLLPTGGVQDVQDVQGSGYFNSHKCAVCQKEGARGLVREGGVVYLHPACEKEWTGKL